MRIKDNVGDDFGGGADDISLLGSRRAGQFRGGAGQGRAGLQAEPFGP